MRRSPRLGIRREILILLPAALLLLVVISSFTLFSYRNAVLRLEEERRSEAARIASGLAAELSALLAPTEADLARIAGGLRAAPAGISILDASGGVVAAIGPLDLRPIPRPRKPGSGLPATLGPLAAENPSVVAFAPLPGRDRVVRVVLPAATLAGQLRATRLLSFVVLPINAALVLLVLFALQQVLGPWERLLARAELAGAPRSPDEDEIEFLLATFERAMAALSAAKLPAEDDLDALERTLAPSFQSGLLLLDRRGGVLSLNDLGADLLGIPVPAADTPLHEALAERPEMLLPLAAALADERGVQREEIEIARGGDRRATLGLTVHPLRRNDGTVRGYLALFTDLTIARRRAEESRLAESLAQLGEMAAGVAHELRNGLATLKGYLTLIDRRPEDDSVAEYLSEMRREGDHLERVLADFLAFARPGSARLEPLKLPELLARAAADPALGGLRVDLSCDPELSVLGDEGLLSRALRNLVQNAAEAERRAGGNGPLEIAASALDSDDLEIVIADRGAGVPGELRRRLFLPFSTGRADGVGLGLALAHRIVTLHGGTLGLEDREGGGTLARLRLPRAGA